MPRVEIPVTAVDRDGVAQPALTNGDATNDHFITGGADGLTLVEIVSSDAGAHVILKSACPRPAPLPMNLLPGTLDK